MDILEKEIEDVVYEALMEDREELSKRGLSIQDGVVLRQPNLASYGIADIVVIKLLKYKNIYKSDFPGDRIETHRHAQCTVIELKKDLINTDTLMQAVRYCRGIDRMFVTSQLQKHIDTNFRIVLIGKRVDTSGDFVYVANTFPNVDLYTYEIDLYKGIRFRRHTDYYANSEDTMPLSDSLIKRLIQNQETYISTHGEEIHQPELEGAAQA